MKKFYSRSTLGGLNKQELIDYIMNLYEDIQHERELNDHMYKAVTQAMHNSAVLSKEI